MPDEPSASADPDEAPSDAAAESPTGTADVVSVPAEPVVPLPRGRRRPRLALAALSVAVGYVAGIGTGWVLRVPVGPAGGTPSVAPSPSIPSSSAHAHTQGDAAVVLPTEGVVLPVAFGTLARRLVDAGAIDLDAFRAVHLRMGDALTPAQEALFTAGSDTPIVVRADTAPFLLSLLWPLGLTNRNQILTEGPMMRQGRDSVTRFASTGGWTLATRPIGDIYASVPLIDLTPGQQRRLAAVAANVYRPCCDNPTAFPDCNHGMAMLALLELLARDDATEDAMYAAARTVNAFWFPAQTVSLATALKATEGRDFATGDPRAFVGPAASASGARWVQDWLAKNGGPGAAPGGGGCAVE